MAKPSDNADLREGLIGLFTALGICLGYAAFFVIGRGGWWTFVIPIGACIGFLAGIIVYIKLKEKAGICSKCGYSTKGLPTNTCPECGSGLSVSEAPGTSDESDWASRILHTCSALGLLLGGGSGLVLGWMSSSNQGQPVLRAVVGALIGVVFGLLASSLIAFVLTVRKKRRRE